MYKCTGIHTIIRLMVNRDRHKDHITKYDTKNNACVKIEKQTVEQT